MNKSRKISWVALLMALFSFTGHAEAQDTTMTIQVNTGNQSTSGVDIYVLVGANKISQGTPPTGTTDNTGNVALPPGLLSSNKPHTQMEAYEVCVNGKKVIVMIPKGSENLLPEDTNDCKKRRIGFFFWISGSSVVVNLGSGGGVTQSGGGMTPSSSNSTGWVKVELSMLGGAAMFSGQTSSKVMGMGAVLFPVGPVFLGFEMGGEFVPSTTIFKVGNDVPTGGSLPTTFVSASAGMTNFLAGGNVEVPFVGFHINIEGGVAVAHVTVAETSGTCAVTCAATSTSNSQELTGFRGGVMISHRIWQRVDGVAGWSYERPGKSSSLDFHVNEVFGGIRVNFGASRP